jgi:hypothetical protein
MNGLLYSQIGYDLGMPMRALVRADDPNTVPPGAVCVLSGPVTLTCPVTQWGDAWGAYWWVCDFSALTTEGVYTIEIRAGDKVLMRDDGLRVGAHILWAETLTPVALDALEERHRRARHGRGWKDCGADWREANSHASTLIGLTDLLAHGFEGLDREQERRLVAQIVIGCDFIASCQDYAAMVGLPDGAVAHEIPNHPLIIPGDQVQCAVAWVRAARLLFEFHPDKSAEYLARGERAFRFFYETCRPLGAINFSAEGHGAPAGYTPPTDAFMTRDVLMALWAAVELWIAGKHAYREHAVSLARDVMARQVPEAAAEDGLWGHFYTFPDKVYTEKANVHHHVGHDTGATFPHYLTPLIEMSNRWSGDPDAHAWRETVQRFAQGYFIPACTRNPFNLLPVGVWPGEGLLTFCGPWHGINTSITYAASLAAQMWMFTGDDRLRDIIAGNLQWIAGLHAGLTREAFGGCVIWKMPADFPEGVALPYSQIIGIGRRSVEGWTDIRGTIPNGFDVNPQFTLTVRPTRANDRPRLWTDEDWIPHSGGWLSALARLREVRFFKG